MLFFSLGFVASLHPPPPTHTHTARERDAPRHPRHQVLQLGDALQGARREDTRRRAGYLPEGGVQALARGVGAVDDAVSRNRRHARHLQVYLRIFYATVYVYMIYVCRLCRYNMLRILQEYTGRRLCLWVYVVRILVCYNIASRRLCLWDFVVHVLVGILEECR